MFSTRTFSLSYVVYLHVAGKTCAEIRFLLAPIRLYSRRETLLRDTGNTQSSIYSCGFPGFSSSLGVKYRNLSFSDIRQFSENVSNKQVTIESALIALMDRWEMEKAVKLIREAVENGNLPNPTVVLNLLQQLGNLGDFRCLLSLREILMDNKLCSKDNFFGCLHEAYHNSGRIEEAVLLLRMLYHDIRKYDDVDVFFTLVGVMLLMNFPGRFYLIENFAEDCRHKEPQDFLPTAGLWKCLVLSGNFDKANKILEDNSVIQQHIPKMISEIASRKNKVTVDWIAALNWLSQLPPDIMKGKLLSHIMVELVKELVKENRWTDVSHCLDTASARKIDLSSEQIRHLLMKAENILFKEELDNFTLIQCIDKLKGFV